MKRLKAALAASGGGASARAGHGSKGHGKGQRHHARAAHKKQHGGGGKKHRAAVAHGTLHAAAHIPTPAESAAARGRGRAKDLSKRWAAWKESADPTRRFDAAARMMQGAMRATTARMRVASLRARVAAGDSGGGGGGGGDGGDNEGAPPAALPLLSQRERLARPFQAAYEAAVAAEAAREAEQAAAVADGSGNAPDEKLGLAARLGKRMRSGGGVAKRRAAEAAAAAAAAEAERARHRARAVRLRARWAAMVVAEQAGGTAGEVYVVQAEAAGMLQAVGRGGWTRAKHPLAVKVVVARKAAVEARRAARALDDAAADAAGGGGGGGGAAKGGKKGGFHRLVHHHRHGHHKKHHKAQKPVGCCMCGVKYDASLLAACSFELEFPRVTNSNKWCGGCVRRHMEMAEAAAAAEKRRAGLELVRLLRTPRERMAPPDELREAQRLAAAAEAARVAAGTWRRGGAAGNAKADEAAVAAQSQAASATARVRSSGAAALTDAVRALLATHPEAAARWEIVAPAPGWLGAEGEEEEEEEEEGGEGGAGEEDEAGANAEKQGGAANAGQAAAAAATPHGSALSSNDEAWKLEAAAAALAHGGGGQPAAEQLDPTPATAPLALWQLPLHCAVAAGAPAAAILAVIDAHPEACALRGGVRKELPLQTVLLKLMVPQAASSRGAATPPPPPPPPPLRPLDGAAGAAATAGGAAAAAAACSAPSSSGGAVAALVHKLVAVYPEALERRDRLGQLPLFRVLCCRPPPAPVLVRAVLRLPMRREPAAGAVLTAHEQALLRAGDTNEHSARLGAMPDGNGNLALHIACATAAAAAAASAPANDRGGGGGFELLLLLLRACPRALRACDTGGRLPLHLAVQAGAPPSVLSELIKRHPGATRHRDLSKRLPLSYAIAENRPPAVTRLLKAQMVSTFTRFQIGFDPNAEIDHH